MVERSGSSAEETQSGAVNRHESTKQRYYNEIDKINSNNKISPSVTSSITINNTNNIVDKNNGTIGNRFSLFRWFKRSGIPETGQQQLSIDNKSECSSSESVNTFYSTATVKSFAFHVGAGQNRENNGPISLDLLDNHHHHRHQVGPFGLGAVKINNKDSARALAVTQTLPAHVLSTKRDITSRYSLQNCAGSYGSCNNITDSESNDTDAVRKSRRVHVRGKRRAPNPPVIQSRPRSYCGVEGIDDPGGFKPVEKNIGSTSRRKQRRPAPPPPPNKLVITVKEEKEIEEEEAAAAEEKSGMEDDSPLRTKNTGNAKNIHQDQVRRANEPSVSESSDKIRIKSQGSSFFKFEKNRSVQSSLTSNSLVLSNGLLLTKKETTMTTNSSDTQNTSAIPRPWYKRSVFENSARKTAEKSHIAALIRDEMMGNNVKISSTADSPSPSSMTTKISSEKSPHGSPNTLSKLNFFRSTDEKKKETKRRSGLSILTNISELDKEAAAIVQEEQAKTKALLLKQSCKSIDCEKRQKDNQEQVIQNIMTSAIESSPRRGTRALISKFNAIGNITKVTVNTNFFPRNSMSNQNKTTEFKTKTNNDSECKIQTKNSRELNRNNVEPDLSKYFPQTNSPKSNSSRLCSSINNSRKSFLQSTLNTNVKINENMQLTNANKHQNSANEPEKIIHEVTNRLSLLQSAVSQNTRLDKHPSPLLVRNSHTQDTKSPSLSADSNTKIFQYESSPKVYRAKNIRELNKTEVIQKEFSDIFDEINEQLNIQQPCLEGNTANHQVKVISKIKTNSELETASKVSTVLDILVEAEKGLHSEEDKKPRRSMMNAGANQITTDLKEMLKEMKHSLPKRPKPRHKVIDPIVEVSSKATSYHENSMRPRNPSISLVGPSAPSTSSSAALGPSGSKDGSEERQKVSSSVQTCGNIRRVVASTSRNVIPSVSSAAQWKNDNVIYRTSGRSKASGSGLVKNTFQLMRPREFAAIEAIKTLKTVNDDNNTYANVMEQSLYANALVLPSRNHRVISYNSAANNRKKKIKIPVPDVVAHNDDKFPVELVESCTATSPPDPIAQNMNTLAVNRLLKKLEAAIANGNHQQAAGFAKELARLKIQCSVIRQKKPKTDDLINLDMYIEDRLAHQGPIPLQLPIIMTVKQLKEKIFNEFEIPANVQRWIIGKTLADNDNSSLHNLNAIDGSPIFLYLVAPDLQIADGAKPIVKDSDVGANPYKNSNNLEIKPTISSEKVPNNNNNSKNNVNNENNREKQHFHSDEQNFPLPVIQLNEIKRSSANNQTNLPPNHRNNDNNENSPKLNEKNPSTSDDRQPVKNDSSTDGVPSIKCDSKQYTQLMMLENCEIVSNIEPIECPICFVIYGPLEGVVLRDCLHTFCRGCIENTIKYCNEAEVKCPYRDLEYTCESTLQEREIKALVNPKIYEQHLAKSVSQAENNAGHNAFHCKTPDCPGWCIYDDNVNNFFCPVCNHNNCLTCRVIHEGKNCYEYQEDVRVSKETDQESKRTAAMLSEMLRRGEAMACPTCDVVLMKKMGCDWLRCSMCKTEICWVTKGPRWGPGGNGDTSGGCRCGQNGVKCHPCCNYCH